MSPALSEHVFPVLKKNRLLYAMNARLKGAQTKHRLNRLRAYYADEARKRGIVYSEGAALRLMRERQGDMVRSLHPKEKGGMTILWVGANWAQDSSGFLSGLQRFGRVIHFLNSKGAYGLLQERRNDVPQNDRCLEQQVSDLVRAGSLDVVMGQMWANFISVDALARIRGKGIPTANVSMDDRLPEHWRTKDGVRQGSVGLARGLDMVLTSSPECCERYLVEGCPALFFPMASDPERFRPFPEAAKEFDVSFVGSKYGLRGRLVTALERAGIAVAAFGPGWPNGAIDADRSAEVFGKSRVILGIGTIAHNDDVYTLKLRDFDATMSGALYVTHRNPDLLTLFEEGKEITCYASIEECVHKVRYYLRHSEERQAIAKAGMARARREHTWEKRLESAFVKMGLLMDASGGA